MSAESPHWYFRWQRRLLAALAEERITPTQVAVLLALSSFADHHSGANARPGIDRLCRATNLQPTAVNKALRAGVDAGLIERVRHGGGSGEHSIATTYRCLADRTTQSSERPSGRTTQSSERPSGRTTQSHTQSHAQSPQRPLPGVPGVPSEDSLRSSSATDRFDEFWNAYPRKVDKPKTRRAWAAALRRCGNADKIIAAARAHGNDPNRVDKFTAYPTTWLNGDRWDDPPIPARTSVRTPAQSVIAAAEADGYTPW